MNRSVNFAQLSCLIVLLQGCVAYIGAPTSVEANVDTSSTEDSVATPNLTAPAANASTESMPAAAPVTGITPLHTAAAGGHSQTVRNLVDRGAEVSAQDSQGQTALHYAASKGHGLTTQTLLELGCDPDARDHSGHAARYYAEKNGHNGTASFLPGGATTALHEAAAAGNIADVEQYVRGAIDVNATDERGQTPLHLAAANGHAETSRTLLRLGADPSLTDKEGRTAQQHANMNSHGGTADMLQAFKEAKEQEVATASPSPVEETVG